MQSNTPTTIPVQRSDPYRDWLGITSPERPPNHYQLLGLAEFESDLAKISAAFENRFGRVRLYQVGARSEEATQLLQRLSAAYAELSDARRKAEYDARLPRPNAGHESETLHDVGATTSDIGKIDGARPPQLPPRAAPATAEPEKDITDGEILPDEPAAADAEKVVQREAVPEAKRASDSENSIGSQLAAGDQLGNPFQAPIAKRADTTPAVVTAFGARRAKAKRRRARRDSPAESQIAAASDPDRISGVERLQVFVLALLAVLPIMLLGLLLVFVAPVALVLAAAYNFAASLALCVLWFLKDGWRVMVHAVIHAIIRIDRAIGTALGEDNHIVHNFVRVVILILVLAAGLALVAYSAGFLL
jgi:curved DNA-binding protein CbpA